VDHIIETLAASSANLLWMPPQELVVPERIIAAIPQDLLAAVRHSPELLCALSGRDFEVLIADVLRRYGFDVTLTQQSRDNGRDIIAVLKPLGMPLKFVIECKRYARDRKVGIGVGQRLYGVTYAERGQKGVVVTTSSFSVAAIRFADQHAVELKNPRGCCAVDTRLRLVVPNGRQW
jgi:HJR/Mrr/RecB family endonuclease